VLFDLYLEHRIHGHRTTTVPCTGGQACRPVNVGVHLIEQTVKADSRMEVNRIKIQWHTFTETRHSTQT